MDLDDNFQMLNWYNLPTYYDVSFSHEMREELAFIKSVFAAACSKEEVRLLEPACGTGRLIIPLTRAGYKCTGFDLNQHALQYTKKKLSRNALQATIFNADMAKFNIKAKKLDGAYCTVDSFRHLLSERDAKQHLVCVAKALKRNAIYILGLHLLPKEGITNKVSRWTAKRGRLTVNTSMTLVEQNKKQRTETLKVILRAKTIKQSYQYESIYSLRTYTLKQLNKLLSDSGVFKVDSVYDHYYDLSKPISLNETSDYAVFLLRRV